jgi:glucosamine-6-phosphate deaminase
VRVVIAESSREVARAAARHVAEILRDRPRGVMGVATGSSPQPLYDELQKLVRAGALDLSTVRAFALDEYVGMDPAHPESYHSIITRDVVRPLAMDPALVMVPDGAAQDSVAAAARFEKAIRDAGGVDVQILGIGSNGHIGFNEPGSDPTSRTRSVALSAETRLANSRFFDSIDEVPRCAITQGVGTILAARSIVLMAAGGDKAQAVRDALVGPIGLDCPASHLRNHNDVTFYLDAEAASGVGHLAEAERSYHPS